MGDSKNLAVGLLVGCIGVAAFAAWNFSGTAAATPAAPEAGALSFESSDSAEGASSAAAPSAASAAAPSGIVQEVIQVTAYTYLRLKSANGEEFWAAIPKSDISQGVDVQLASAELMTGFHSKQLDRTFDAIYFGSLDDGAVTPSGVHGALPVAEHGELSGSPGSRGGRAQAADMVEIHKSAQAPGPGGKRVAEVFENKQSLSGTKVQVRGTIVSVTANVMGTNFVHVRDGSGDAASATHDLTLKVAEDPPPVGEEALFEGTVTTDVDLGAGYNYSVLIEAGRIVR